MNDQQKLDELEQSIIDLKIRLERVEEFLISFPNPYRFIHKKDILIPRKTLSRK
jgi:hypothetical protein